jgi:hypothetical protein
MSALACQLPKAAALLLASSGRFAPINDVLDEVPASR